jgi:hypothetical protein
MLFVPAAGGALAGPNADGTLVVHLAELDSSCDVVSQAPSSCEAIENQAPVGSGGYCGAYVWQVYAAFLPTASPRLKALSMGGAFTAHVYVVTGGLPDPVADFELPDEGWPTQSGTGIGISFGSVKTGILELCYWFAGYGYSGHWSVIPHPIHGAVFVDDTMPPHEDPVLALGSLGFGVPGYTPCPLEVASTPEEEPGESDPVSVERSWGRLKGQWR